MTTMTTPALESTESLPPSARDDKMPNGIPFIIANEFAERFCYYGINAILSIYMTKYLRMGEAEATTFHSLFKSGAYFFPIVGAIVSDVFWGKFRTIITFSLAYALGCTILATVPGVGGLALGLFLMAFGTGGIKPCVSANVGDQFSAKNQHLIERAFSWFYLSINAGSSISIYFCPVLLEKYGRFYAFGMPAAAMLMATLVFWMGRKKFTVVPPAGKQWLEDVMSKEGRSIIGSLLGIYLFIACFWALWEQSNGQTWTLQAESSLMDKTIFGFTVLPAQIQVVNGFWILALIPVFSYGVYPFAAKFVKVTPLRKIGTGFFLTATSFLIVSWIESRIQAGHTVSVAWQIVAYGVLSASEVLVSITGLEFSYKQAPLRMKSFITALFLLSVSLGNAATGIVNWAMIKPVHAVSAQAGAETWVTLDDTSDFVVAQKIDFAGQSGLTITDSKGQPEPLAGTYLVAENDVASHRLRLMDRVDRKPIASAGTFDAAKAEVTTYRLVGPQYFNFFAEIMAAMGIVFIFVAMRHKERTFVRTEEAPAT